MRCMATVLATALLAAAPVATRAEIVEVKWDTGGRFERRLDVPAGKFAEVCGSLAVGTKVRWQFDAAAPLNFNIHYHEGKDVRFPARHDGMQRMDGVLEVKSREDHCWMWTNKTPGAVGLNVQLQRE